MIMAVKTESDLSVALSRIEHLMDLDPDAHTKEAEELEILAVLVENYETKKMQDMLPDPVEAILFRMEQQNLTQRDLVPFIGSRSRVSEVLSRKRPLTLPMIKALHNGLGIPAKALLQQEHDPIDYGNFKIEWNKFPSKEMERRGWLKDYSRSTANVSEAVQKFFDDLRPVPIIDVLYKKTHHMRSARAMDTYSLAAWTARVINVASKQPPKQNYVRGRIDPDFMKALARLSVFEDGPILARKYLSDQGVAFVVEPHLPKTFLDGSAIFVNAECPIIGLTIRHDRIDNFWFCLMHELAHIYLHIDKGMHQFYDDLDIIDGIDLLENEADTLAGEVLIPQSEWKNSPASKFKSADSAHHLAKKLGIHTAIVAGKIRHEFNEYRLLNNLVGHNEIRELFKESRWK